MEKIAIIETWTESEAGFGQRPDGVSIHLTKEDCENYVKKYWETMSDNVPDEYSRPDGNLNVIKVTDELYEDIKKSDYGIRIWNHNFKDIKDKIEYII